MYNVMWENAIASRANKPNTYLMYPNELITGTLADVEYGPSPLHGSGGGKRARKTRKSRKVRKYRKSRKVRKSRKARKSRRRARR
jgi:hypothetical protein